jgi:hypothetical protein
MARTSAKKTANSARKTRGPAEIAPGVFVGGWSDAVGFEGKRYCVLDEKPDEELPADEQLRIYDGERDEAIRPNLDRLGARSSTPFRPYRQSGVTHSERSIDHLGPLGGLSAPPGRVELPQVVSEAPQLPLRSDLSAPS